MTLMAMRRIERCAVLLLLLLQTSDALQHTHNVILEEMNSFPEVTTKDPEIKLLMQNSNLQDWIVSNIIESESYVPPAEYINRISQNDPFGIQFDIWHIQTSVKYPDKGVYISDPSSLIEAGQSAKLSYNYYEQDQTMHLMHFPIGKNLAAMGLTIGTLLPHRGILVSGVNRHRYTLELENNPWTWSRVKDCQLEDTEKHRDDISKSWGCYFQMLDSRPAPHRREGGESILPLLTTLENRMGFWANTIPGKLSAAYLISQSTWYSFQLNARTKRAVERRKANIPGWPLGENSVLASIHLRRGDVIGFNCTGAHRIGRKCTTLPEQITRLEKFTEFNVTHVYLACEDPLEILYARKLAPQYTWLSSSEIPSRRKMKPVTTGCKDVMEICLLNKLNAKNISHSRASRLKEEVDMFLLDIDIASQAKVNILEEKSCTSSTIFFLSYGRKGYIPPHSPSMYKYLQVCGGLPDTILHGDYKNPTEPHD